MVFLEIIEILETLIKNYFFGLAAPARLKIVYFYPFLFEILENFEKFETVVENKSWGWSCLSSSHFLIVSGQEQTGADSNTQKWLEAARNGQLPPPT